jgi:beta-galactosidase
VLQDDKPWVVGEFVWTGFDYLGEPTPYESWPSRSSYFGINDLAGLPRTALFIPKPLEYQESTLHILPHWNWEGREGETTPVFIRTTTVLNFYKWQKHGVQKKNEHAQNRYRLMWMDVKYEPGTVKWWLLMTMVKLLLNKCILLASLTNSFRPRQENNH